MPQPRETSILQPHLGVITSSVMHSLPVSRVAVSYAWKAEDGGTDEGAVTHFCEELRKADVDVIRDSDRLKFGECISEFMSTIGQSEFLCVFLSDAYLKSPNCMYELLVAWQKYTSAHAQFRERVKVWVMQDADGIRNPEARFAYSKYWQDEANRRERLLAEAGLKGRAPAEIEQYSRIQKFALSANEMLCFMADTLSPSSSEQFVEWVRSKLSEGTLGIHKKRLAANSTRVLADVRKNPFTYGMRPKGGDGPHLTESQVIDLVRVGGSAVIEGSGGSGKSSKLYLIAELLLAERSYVRGCPSGR
jgi:hypothetical protein